MKLFENFNFQNALFSRYSSVPNKRAGGKILEKH
jgi:hypothetical protein